MELSEIIFLSLISLLLVITAGAMSGLTVGLLSIDDLDMELTLSVGSEEEKRQAERVLPVIEKHHLLLVSLLLANATAMEALPLVLDELMPVWAAILASVTFVLIFGEILPQAFCVGPDQIKIASAMVPMVKLLMCLLYPIGKPIAMCLDKMFGHQGKKRYNITELKALIDIHTQRVTQYQKEITRDNLKSKSTSKKIKSSHEEIQLSDQINISRESPEAPLLEKEGNIIRGALEIRNKTVKDIMIPLEQAYMLSWDCVMDEERFQDIHKTNFSRIPVYKNQKHCILGILLSKQIVSYDPSSNQKLKDAGFKLKDPIVANPNMPLIDLLPLFTQGKNHMAIVTNQENQLKMSLHFKEEFTGEVIGICTLEDVLEILLQMQIYDEFDTVNANRDTFKKERNIQKIIIKELLKSRENLKL